MEFVEQLFEQYGYYVVFFGLLLEYIALPFPGELTMAYGGYLAYTGLLNFWLLVCLSFSGTVLGMTFAYWFGYYVGTPFFQRFGKWLLLSPEKLALTGKWFEKYGSWVLFFAYFVPGVRHITGYFSGVIRLKFHIFALYAYGGALFWVLVFVGIGRIFGKQWQMLFARVEDYAFKLLAAAVILAGCFFLFKFRKKWLGLFGKRP